MARSDISGTATGRRIMENSQGKSGSMAPAQPETMSAAERLLSRPVDAGKAKSTRTRKKRKRKKKQARSLVVPLIKMVMILGVVLGGIAVISWMRDLAFKFGIVWTGG